MVIYKIKNKINGKIYIGQTINFKQRINAHINTAENKYKSAKKYPVHRAIAKYGKENFSYEIIYEAKTKTELDEREAYYIQKYISFKSEYGYNIKLGGSKEKLPESVKKKISNSQKGELNHAYGKPSKRRKPVICLTNNTEYESVTDASLKTGISISQIARVCRGERGSVKGLVFRYIEEGKVLNYNNKKFKEVKKKIVDKNSGKVFESFKEAMVEFGITSNSLSYHIRRYGYYKKGNIFLIPEENVDKDFNIEFDSKVEGKNVKNITKDKNYPSIKAACQDIGYEWYSNLALRLRKNNGECEFRGYKFKYIKK